MEFTLDYIVTKESDFKVCKKCNTLNWYENEECRECGSILFDNSRVRDWIENEYAYWINVEGFEEDEIDKIFVEA